MVGGYNANLLQIFRCYAAFIKIRANDTGGDKKINSKSHYYGIGHEKYGSGFTRIIKSFLDFNLPMPVFENFQSGFRTIARDLENMRLRNLIQRIDGDKGGYWKIETKE